MSKPLKIVVAGYIAAFPLGGMTWHHLNYLLSLKRLGHDVLFLEDNPTWLRCYNPQWQSVTDDPTYGLAYLRQTLAAANLDIPFCFYHEAWDQYHGLSRDELHNFLSSADLLLCVSGITPLREDRPHPRRTAVIDTDPVFTQLRMRDDPAFLAYYQSFDAVATFGRLIGSSASPLPTHGLHWIPTNQPIDLPSWPVTPVSSTAFTTIGKWEHAADRHLEFQGQKYRSSKGVEWLKLLDLPARQPFQLTLGMQSLPPETASLFQSHGWSTIDPESATVSTDSYRAFIQNSAGELTVAKEIYAALPSGWFSDRSAAYLASARPVVTQASGFDQWLPTGQGLFSFTTIDEAATALTQIATNPTSHSRAARSIAEKYFDGAHVLTDLLERVL